MAKNCACRQNVHIATNCYYERPQAGNSNNCYTLMSKSVDMELEFCRNNSIITGKRKYRGQGMDQALQWTVPWQIRMRQLWQNYTMITGGFVIL